MVSGWMAHGNLACGKTAPGIAENISASWASVREPEHRTDMDETTTKLVMTAFSEGMYTDFTGYICFGKTEGFVENATFELVWLNPHLNGVDWKEGTWINGVLEYGDWHGGIWLDGTWESGIWRNGDWYNGTWKWGRFVGGTWHDGVFENGCFDDGKFLHGKWLNGMFKDKRIDYEIRL